MQAAEIQQEQHYHDGGDRNACGRPFHGRREEAWLGRRVHRRGVVGGSCVCSILQGMRDGRMHGRRVRMRRLR